MSATKHTATEVEMAIDQLRSWFPKGSTAYTVLRHVSQSGMTRSISVLTGANQGEIHDVSYLIARSINYTMDQRRGGLKVTGAGMDMGFNVVYTLGMALYGDGYALNHRWI